MPRKYRTVSMNIPATSKQFSSLNGQSSNNGASSPTTTATASTTTTITTNHGLLLTRQALQSYESNHHIVHYKYSAFGGSCHDLPRSNQMNDEFRDEIYEIDADVDRIDEEMTRSQADTITKQGYLLKGPETSSDRVFANIGSKSFKRRYVELCQMFLLLM